MVGTRGGSRRARQPALPLPSTLHRVASMPSEGKVTGNRAKSATSPLVGTRHRLAGVPPRAKSSAATPRAAGGERLASDAELATQLLREGERQALVGVADLLEVAITVFSQPGRDLAHEHLRYGRSARKSHRLDPVQP
jgi:hypothetical protein